MCTHCNHATWLHTIDEMLRDAADIPERGEDFAAGVTDTLEDMRAWIEENEHVTEKQQQAIENMQAAVGRWL